MIAYLMKVL